MLHREWSKDNVFGEKIVNILDDFLVNEESKQREPTPK